MLHIAMSAIPNTTAGTTGVNYRLNLRYVLNQVRTGKSSPISDVIITPGDFFNETAKSNVHIYKLYETYNKTYGVEPVSVSELFIRLLELSKNGLYILIAAYNMISDHDLQRLKQFSST